MVNPWRFTVVFEIDDLPDHMYAESFFEGIQPKVIFPLKDYKIIEVDFISATLQVQVVELFIDFETAYHFKEVVKDFEDNQIYYFNIVVGNYRFKVRGRVIEMYFPDNYDPYIGYKFLTSRKNREIGD